MRGLQAEAIQFLEMPMKIPVVYMMANKRNGTIYIGVTSNMATRDYIHKHRLLDGFTSRYGCHLLVWYEVHETMESAILREKQLKAGSRKKKLALIENLNPEWRDLSAEL